jgi:hypothetical protein
MVMMHCNVGVEVEQLDRPLATVIVTVIFTVGLRSGLRCRRSLS